MSGCDRQSGPVRPTASSSGPSAGPAASMEGMRATEYRAGRKRWELAADRAAYDQGPERVALQGVSLTVAGKPQVGTVTLTAPRADFMNTSKDLHLPVGVAATGDRGLRFTARQAVFRNASSLLAASGEVQYRDELLQVEGDEMVLDIEARDLILRRNVRATISPRAVAR